MAADIEVDVVVIGYGGAGAAAAIEAHDRGAKVSILEKTAKPGGETLMTYGGFLAAESSVQKKAGVKESADDLFRLFTEAPPDVRKPRVKALALEVARAVAYRSGETIDFLEKLGVVFDTSGLFVLARGYGVGLWEPLRKAVESRGINVSLETPATSLVRDKTGRVRCLRFQSGGVTKTVLARKGVVLAAGGYAANLDMLKAYNPMWSARVRLTHAGATGDGIKMAQMVGADLYCMDVPPHGGPLVTGAWKNSEKYTNPYLQWAFFSAPMIYVNKRGRRFVDETLHAELQNQALHSQEEQICYAIFDNAALGDPAFGIRHILGGSLVAVNFDMDLAAQVREGIVKRASSVHELATAIDLDHAALKSTIESYNAGAKRGVDPEIGRKVNLRPIENPPFYAMEMTVGFSTTRGGLRIDAKCRVLDVNNRVIPGLYAAGDTSLLPTANPLISAMTTGRIAGINVAEEKT